MNECVSGDSLGCSNERINFYTTLHSLFQKTSKTTVESLAGALKQSSQKVRQCDELGIHCIDFVTELLTDSSASPLLPSIMHAVTEKHQKLVSGFTVEPLVCSKEHHHLCPSDYDSTLQMAFY